MLDGTIVLLDGAFLLLMYAAFIGHSVRNPVRIPVGTDEDEGKGEDVNWAKIAWLLVGVVLLVVGARYLITSATRLMTDFGLTGTFVGFVFVALGFSLPEVLTAVTAAWRGHSSIAIGNVIGANTVNTLVVVGVGTLVGSLPVSQDILVLTVGGVLFLTVLLGFSLAKSRITNFEGVLYVIIYLVILVTVFGPV